MRFQFALPLAALACMLAAHTQAQAGHCGASNAGCATDCCTPKIRYRTHYETVRECKQVPCWQTVQRTEMREVTVIECKPVAEKKEIEVTKIICEPKVEEKKVKVSTGDWKTEQVVIPGGCTTKRVWVAGCCYVDPCTGCTRQSKGHWECVTCKNPDQICNKQVWVPREEERVVKVTTMERKEVKEKQTVTVTRMERVEVKKMVPYTVCEKVCVMKTVEVCRKVKVCVPECVCEKPSLHDRLKAKFASHGKSCCNSGCGGGYGAAYVAPEPIKANPMPK